MKIELLLPKYFYMLPSGKLCKEYARGAYSCHIVLRMPDEILIEYAIEGQPMNLLNLKAVANGYVKGEYFSEYQKRIARALLPFAIGELRIELSEICGDWLDENEAAIAA